MRPQLNLFRTVQNIAIDILNQKVVKLALLLYWVVTETLTDNSIALAMMAIGKVLPKALSKGHRPDTLTEEVL